MEPVASPAVFLSHASQDSEPARRIAEALRGAGIVVWFDQSELRGGDAWDASIRQQIKACALFVPLISARTEQRPEGYFRLEWRLADQRTHLMGRTRPFIVPVVLDATPQADADVPESFQSVHWTPFSEDESALADFAVHVRHLLAGPGEFHRPSPPVSPSPWAPREKSIAVLAFANLSDSAETEYFSDGISEDLLNALAHVPGLSVTARTSSFFFKGRNVPVPEIARQLGVAHVLEGSVRRAGNRVRITAQLIAADGFHVWSERFDRELSDIFALQDEIAGAIAAKLEMSVVPRRAREPADPEVHRLVLQGRFLWNQFTEEALAQAETLFKTALGRDPRCAPALAGLANVGCRRAILTCVASRHITSGLAQAETDARAALAADATLAEPHAVLGTVAHMRGQLADAGREFREALALNPSSDLTLVYHARLLQCRGRPDLAVAELDRAHRLSPLVGAFAGHRATALIACRRFAEAINVAAEAETLSAGSAWTRALWALALARTGRRDEAVTKARCAIAAETDDAWVIGMRALFEGTAAWALAEAEETSTAASLAERLLQNEPPWRYAAGLPLAALGRPDEAFPLLADLPHWIADHVMILADRHESFRRDPRFDALLQHLDATDAFAAFRRAAGATQP